MLNSAEPIVIIGAGESGTRTALTIRQLGWDGPLTLIGEENTAPYERPPLSKQRLSSPDSPVATITTASELHDRRIDFLQGRRAVGIDRTSQVVSLDNDSTLPYGQLLIATGSRARPLPIAGGDHAITLRQITDIERVLEAVRTPRLCVIGAGLIGLEIAAQAWVHGTDVIVVEAADEVLSRVAPPAMASLIRHRHERSGVSFVLGTQAHRIGRHNDQYIVTLSNGTAIECDRVIAAIGSIPNCELATDAGLLVANGIVVDDQLRSSDPLILSAGDCCSFPAAGSHVRLEAWRNAHDQANVAAQNLAGSHISYVTVPWFWSDQYDFSVQVVGTPSAGATDVERHTHDSATFVFSLDVDGVLVAASGLGTGSSAAKTIRAAQMLIEDRCIVDPAALADPTVSLRAIRKTATT